MQVRLRTVTRAEQVVKTHKAKMAKTGWALVAQFPSTPSRLVLLYQQVQCSDFVQHPQCAESCQVDMVDIRGWVHVRWGNTSGCLWPIADIVLLSFKGVV